MSSRAIHTPVPQAILVLVDEQPAGHQVSAPSAHPTGAEILLAAGRPAAPNQIVLQILEAGGTESIRLDERADLAAGSTFVLSTGDRTFRYTIDLAQFEWPHNLISAGTVRRVGNVAPDYLLGLARPDGVQLLDEHDVVDLANTGLEKFLTLPPVGHHVWKLKVQGVVLEYHEPHVKVADAMTQAGFDPKKAWHIYLIVH
ncbi:MAG: multiubiquitin domain-containing protein, partial [Paucibacter sp.]|nr:multiubiquitin domain-containing protein [Roseateles sp.]